LINDRGQDAFFAELLEYVSQNFACNLIRRAKGKIAYQAMSAAISNAFSVATPALSAMIATFSSMKLAEPGGEIPKAIQRPPLWQRQRTLCWVPYPPKGAETHAREAGN
jgi:hypothetical protein